MEQELTASPEEIILFHSHDIDFQLLQEDSVRDWILLVVSGYGKSIQELSYVFCSDAFLLEMNQAHLSHDYYTDIITFPYQDDSSAPLWGEIYLSIDRIRENAQAFGVSMEDELHRVMIHGVLHLIGLDDHSEEDVAAMRAAEEAALQIRPEGLC
ncbi:MAG: rRNA maturation RNase YbeY [Bacteroidetes bacterium]|nr:MAG: rRNA maturation RNase YbeY [Bacteroidota bacterium]